MFLLIYFFLLVDILKKAVYIKDGTIFLKGDGMILFIKTSKKDMTELI